MRKSSWIDTTIIFIEVCIVLTFILILLALLTCSETLLVITVLFVLGEGILLVGTTIIRMTKDLRRR